MTGKRIPTILAALLGTGLAASPARAACPACEKIVAGQDISNTYSATSVVGSKLCTPNSTVNAYGVCTDDANCGGTAGQFTKCIQTPWVFIGGIAQPTPPGSVTTFKVTADSGTSCNHTVCIPCGALATPCPSAIPLGDSCCSTPGFTLASFAIPALGICVHVDQTACGEGTVNSRNPQAGDNDVTRRTDTSDPGADCQYNTADDPKFCNGGAGTCVAPPKGAGCPCTVPADCASGVCGGAAQLCTTAVGGAGYDTKGRTDRTVGNTVADASGIHYRLRYRSRSVTWLDKQCSGGTGNCTTPPYGPGCPCSSNPQCNSSNCVIACGPTAIYDAGETLVSTLPQVSESTTASATGQFNDQNADGCSLAGAGFLGTGMPGTGGPFTVTGIPQPYGGGGYTSMSVGTVVSGFNTAVPLYDVGFISVTPNSAPVKQPTNPSCTCTFTAACPE